MKQSKRLQPIHAFKLRQEEEAAKKLAKASLEIQQKKKSLLDLESYRCEYDQKFLKTSSEGVSAKRMKDYQAFMNNLAQVLGQQKAAIKMLESEFEQKKRQWLAAKNRTTAIGKVQQGYQQREDTIEEKKEQREQDDRSSRITKH